MDEDKKPIVFIEPAMAVLSRADLGHAEKLVFLYWANRQGRNDDAFVGIERAAKHLRMGKSYIRKCLTRLRDVGLMKNEGLLRQGSTMRRRVIMPDDIDYPAPPGERPDVPDDPEPDEVGAPIVAPPLHPGSAGAPPRERSQAPPKGRRISSVLSAQVSTQESTQQDKSTSGAKVAVSVPSKPKAPKKPEPRPPDPGPEPNCLDDIEDHKRWTAETLKLRRWKDAR